MPASVQFNLADLFELVADTVPDHEAVVSGTRRLTYRQLDERANRLAHHLSGRGVRPGDRVAVLLANGAEYLETMLAAFKIRAVPFNANPRYVDAELAYLLADADAVAAVFDARLAAPLARASREIASLRELVEVDPPGSRPRGAPPADDGAGPFAAARRVDGYEVALAGSSPERAFPERRADDVYVLYTGGTTGAPKGVIWTHEDIFFAAMGGGGFGEPVARPDDLRDRCRDGRMRCLPACPLSHGTAQWAAFATLFAGGSVVIPASGRFDPVETWETVLAEAVNYLVIVGDAFAVPLLDALDAPATDGRPGGVPTIGGRTLDGPAVLLSGGAILSAPVKRELAERLPHTLVVDGYGSSESGGQGQAVTSRGSPVPEVPRFTIDRTTAVLGPDLRPVPVGTVGKIARRGRVPLGYHKDPERSRATFPVVDGERWAVPGDDAVVEADGRVTLLGRGSTSINTGGEKVYPEEVESVLKGHPAVADAVVVGVPDRRWGEVVVAVVTAPVAPPPGAAGPDSPVDESVRAHVRSRLAGFKVPRRLVWVDRAPRDATGKPDHARARELAGTGGPDTGRGSPTAAPAAPRR